MFAEELGCNTGRKKAEENRARRKRIQQQQQQRHTPSALVIAAATASNSSTTTTTNTINTASPAGAETTTTTTEDLCPNGANEKNSNNVVSTVGSSTGIVAPSENEKKTDGVPSPTPVPTTAATASATTPVSSAASLSNTNNLSVIERTKYERALRNQKNTQKLQCIKIQSYYRKYNVQKLLRQQLMQQLDDQLNNNNMKNIDLNNQSISMNQEMTSIVRQLLFLTYMKRRNNTTCNNNIINESIQITTIHLNYLQQLLELFIIPNMSRNSNQNNNNILNEWICMDGIVGLYRLKIFLRYVSCCVIHKQCTEKQFNTILQFMKLIIKRNIIANNKNQFNLQDICYSILFPSNNNNNYTWPRPTSLSIVQNDNNANNNSYNNDWILLLRHFMLFYQHQTTIADTTSSTTTTSVVDEMLYRPIPNDIDTKRDACFSVFEKYRVNRLLRFLLYAADELSDSTTSTNKLSKAVLQSKIVTHIFTIPLLTWRIKTIAATTSDSKIYDDDALHYLTSSSSLESTQQQQKIHQSTRLMQLLESFVQVHSETLNNGTKGCTTNNQNVKSVRSFSSHDAYGSLPYEDVPMTVCPVAPTQCFLANLIQLGQICPTLHPPSVSLSSSSVMFSYASTSFYFDVVSLLIDIVPLSTYTTKESSAVEWIDDGHGHLKPVILSNVVLDQCRGILVDTYIRRLFSIAMDNIELQTTVESILLSKNDTDTKHEKDMMDVGGTTTSAASLAAKEARIDQNKTFWNSSNWAKQLTKGVTKLFAPSTTTTSSTASSCGGSGGVLMDTSSVSRMVAKGKISASVSSMKPSKTTTSPNSQDLPTETFTISLLLSLLRTYAILLARWGGGGSYDVVHGGRGTSAKSESTNTSKKTMDSSATVRAEPFTLSLLNVLCFSTPIVRTLWGLIQRDQSRKMSSPYDLMSDIIAIIDPDKGRIPVHSNVIGPIFNKSASQNKYQQSTIANNNEGSVALFMFLYTFSHVLIITDDVEIHDMDKPLPMHQIRRCIMVLKKLLYRAACVDTQHDSGDAAVPNYFGYSLITISSKTMKDLYDRSSRRPFCVPSMWTMPKLLEREFGRCKTFNDYQTLLAKTPVLRLCPFLVSFKRRLKLFERIITTNRIEIQGENSANPFHNNPLKQGIPVRITRGRILEDGLLTMNTLGRNMLRQRIQVQYYNEAGVRETGIDAGGLFKDFWTDLCAIAFNPNYALFQVTEAGASGNCMYPNPLSRSVHGASDHIVLFEFLGRILGKALYEGITINPRFAHFFLSFLRGDYNFLHMLPDLSTVDPQLYNNLMFLKNYDGDCSDLSLTFTVTVDDFGGTKEIPLIPNGGNIDVTNDNKQRYIGLVAKYYIFDRVKEQSEAFTRGLWDVLDRSWLQLFNEPELQVLVSGVAEGKLDVEDMKAHVQYVGGYSSLDRTICRFWNVVSALSTKQQADLLRFVTGCERPPPLGFGSMNPPFTIQRVGTGGNLLRGDGDRLPSASTCFNVLKLPCYGSEKILKERLIYAIESGAGFELS